MQTRERNPWVVLSVLLVGFFMTLLDTTIVNIAIPDMVTGLDASLDQVLWFVNAYTLVFAALQLLSGRLGDRLGSRTMFIAGLMIFTVASAACGLAGSAEQMIITRSVQGLGAAVMMPQTLALISVVFPPQKRGAAFGVWSSVAGLAIIAGPTLGGLLVSTVGWRWIFFINMPLGAFAVVAALMVVPNARSGRRPRLDLPGVLLSTVALFLVIFALIEGQRYKWGTVFSFVTIPAVLVAGVVVFAVFLLLQRRRQERDPLLPFELFRNRVFSVSVTLSSVILFASVGLLLPLTIYLQSVLGLSAIVAGLVLVPPSVISLLLSPVAGSLVAKVGGRAILVPGLLLYGGGVGLAGLMAEPDSSPWVLLPGLILFGIGMGVVFPAINTLAMRDVPPPLAGAASGVLATTRQLGTVLGAAAVGLLLQNRLASEVTEQAAQRLGDLPPEAQAGFQDNIAAAVDRGLDVGVGQSGGIPLPPGLSEQAAQETARVTQDVFGSAFTTAATWALVLTAAVQVAGMLLALLLPGRAKPPAEPSDTPVTAGVTGERSS
ncbi:EmrB/QacA subfamily drug resistance transporter [Kibdelosporangium banguiense]|uniref:EmrB/QacA subfamily drug resistance transporter n=1 Tax=Kibdelosporangium banguiense TaxID=1365924 RepID=A0ABS4TRX1_9PSEU|nr:DHA2 family efflux MFS transporter permease subunit [Kibdelosporangium banguiense]MBP2327151.1 EmrB/QacA subfamily drug resistance transporter [Kibdelosporangium banguiense]